MAVEKYLETGLYNRCSLGMARVFNILFFEKISENVEFGPEN
jgi:hypothetical protein